MDKTYKIKNYINKIIKILSLEELSILPTYLAYSLVLITIPIITIIAVILGTLNISVDTIVELIKDLLPNYASSVIIEAISGDTFDWSVGALNLATFVVAANGMYKIVNISNKLYKIKSESQLKDRLKSLIILIIMINLLLFMIIVPMLGDIIIKIISNYIISENILNLINTLYSLLKWPITLLSIYIIVKIIYTIAPSAKIKSKETTLGALTTTAGWTIFTAIFGYYIELFAKYDIIYGGLSSIIILLIWFFVLSYILILGIVINTTKYNNSKKEL